MATIYTLIIIALWFIQAPIASGLARRFGFLSKDNFLGPIFGLYWPPIVIAVVISKAYCWIERKVAGDVQND